MFWDDLVDAMSKILRETGLTGNENVNQNSKTFSTHFAAQASSRLVCYVCSDLALLLALVLPLPHYSFRKELGYQDYLSKTALNHREIKFDNQIGSYSLPRSILCRLYQAWWNILGQQRRMLALVLALPHYSLRKELGYQDYLCIQNCLEP